MRKKTFATAINCMDGRTQLPVIDYVSRRFAVDYVDSITEPGPDGVLSQTVDEATIDSIRRRVEISVREHGSKHIAVVGHHDCAGNPVEERVHFEQIKKSVESVRSWQYGCEVIGLWVDQNGRVYEIW